MWAALCQRGWPLMSVMTGKLLVATAITVCLAAACGGDGGRTTPAPPRPSSSPSPVEETVVTIYYLVDSGGRLWLAPERHRIRRTPAIAEAALEELIHGRAQDPDHTTPLPSSTRILGIRVTEGTATVDWSAEVLAASTGAVGEGLGIQSVVWTLTEFPTIKRVAFTVEGKSSGQASNGRGVEDWWGHVGLYDQPFTRQAAAETLEPITIWSPVDGQEVGTTLTVEGDASTVGGSITLRLSSPDGRTVQTSATIASRRVPERGTFKATIGIEKPPTSREVWRLEAYEAPRQEAADGFVETRSIVVASS